MLSCMDTQIFDRKLVGNVVRKEVNRRFGSVSAFVVGAELSRKTVERVMTADPKVTFATFERIEGALDLPRDTLSLVGAHDLDGLKEIGVEPDLVRWIASELRRERPKGRRTG